MGGQIIKFDPI